MRISYKVNLKVLIWIYLIIYPILPSYTRLFGYTVYSLMTILFFGIMFILNANKLRTISKSFLLVSFLVIILYSIPFLYHGEVERIVYEFIEVFLPIVLLLFSFKFFHKEDMDYAISLLVITSFIICIFGIFEFVTSFNVFSLVENMQYDNPRFGSLQTTRLGVIRIEQSFNTALSYALYISMAFSLTFYMFFSSKNKIYIIVMLVQIINVLLTMTRGVSLVFILGIGMLIFVNRKYLGIKRITSIVILALLLMIVVVMLFPNLLNTINEMLGSAINLIFGGQADIDDSSALRQGYQAAAINALQSGEVLAFGVGEYGLRNMVSIDNEWLLEITGYGIFGFIAFIILLLVPIKAAYDGLKQSRLIKMAESELFFRCMLVMLLEYYVSLYTVAQMAEAKMFYVLLAIIVTYSRIIRKEKNCGINCNSQL